MQFKINDILSYDIFGIICFPNSNMKNLIIDDHVIHIWTECRFTNGSRSLGLVGFAASRNKADARHHDLPYFYNPQQVAVVLAIQAIQLFNLKLHDESTCETAIDRVISSCTPTIKALSYTRIDN